MNLVLMQRILESRFAGDYTRAARMRHFIGLLKTAVDGMTAIGVVLRVEADGLNESEIKDHQTPDMLESLDSAIRQMTGGQHG